jgi:hypothetical protein
MTNVLVSYWYSADILVQIYLNFSVYESLAREINKPGEIINLF